MNRQPAREHSVVLKTSDGGAEIHPMKQWLRAHPEHVPPGVDASASGSTSQELRRALRNSGWILDERDDRVLVIKPDESGDISFAREFLSSSTHSENDAKIESQVAGAEEITFGLERDLQLALRRNIEQLEPGLRIIDDGRERQTEAGRIDITAEDNEGYIVVVELEAGAASPDVIAQILAYMGVVAETDKKPVRGILVAGDFHRRVIFAARVSPTLHLSNTPFNSPSKPWHECLSHTNFVTPGLATGGTGRVMSQS
jgi:hypothetical protein